MRTAVSILLVLLFAAPARAAQTPGEWVKHASPEGRYSVRLPGEPKHSAQTMDTPAGEKLKQYMAQASDSNCLVMVGYFDYTAAMTFSLDKAREGMVSAVKGTLLAENSISLGGHPGKELRVAVKAPNGQEFITRARYYDVAGRVYVLQCIFLKATEGPALAEKCERFFDSFKVEAAR